MTAETHIEKLEKELRETQARLHDAEETLRAVRGGDVDAFVVQGEAGPQIFTLKDAAEPYQMLIEQMPEGALTLSATGIVLYCNKALAGIIGLPTERIVGASMREWISQGNLARLLSESGCFGEEISLTRPDGGVATIVASSAPLKREDEHLICVVVRDVTRQQLRLRYEALVQVTSDAVFILTPAMEVETWNPGAEKLFGYSSHDMIGQTARKLFKHEAVSTLENTVENLQNIERTISTDVDLLTKNGETLHAIMSLAPLRDEKRRITGYATIVHDITQRKQAEERVLLLMNEVNHRSKNMLNLVSAVARQTAASTPGEFLHRFEERIHALAASQDLLVSSKWTSVPLEELIRSQLAHFKDLVGSRIVLHGHAISVTPQAAQALGMAFHELATNAGKYGALSNDTGCVDIRWSVTAEAPDQPQFEIGWIESKGPEVVMPSRRGFGSTVIEQLAKANLSGQVALDYAPGGLMWHLACPLDLAVANWQRVLADVLPRQRPPAGHRPRILIVENEARIALEIDETLRSAG